MSKQNADLVSHIFSAVKKNTWICFRLIAVSWKWIHI